MFFRFLRKLKTEPLPLTMAAVRMGERLLQIENIIVHFPLHHHALGHTTAVTQDKKPYLPYRTLVIYPAIESYFFSNVIFQILNGCFAHIILSYHEVKMSFNMSSAIFSTATFVANSRGSPISSISSPSMAPSPSLSIPSALMSPLKP